MSLIQHTFFPRSMFDMDRLLVPNMGLSTLDVFDPFDDLDQVMSRNLRWLDRPLSVFPITALEPKVPQKYRVSLDCSGYKPSSLKVDRKEDKIVISGSEETADGGDFHKKEFKKTFELPAIAEFDKMVSFMTPSGQLIVEMPLKETKASPNSDLLPQIVDKKDGGKEVQMKFVVPPNINPEKLHVSVKDRDLILKYEDKKETEDSFSSVSFYKRSTLPENTDFENLKCVNENNQLMVTAPVKEPRHIPIEAQSSK